MMAELRADERRTGLYKVTGGFVVIFFLIGTGGRKVSNPGQALGVTK